MALFSSVHENCRPKWSFSVIFVRFYGTFKQYSLVSEIWETCFQQRRPKKGKISSSDLKIYQELQKRKKKKLEMIIWDSGAFLVGLEFIMENVKKLFNFSASVLHQFWFWQRKFWRYSIPCLSLKIFLTPIWLPHGQLWAIIEEAASLTRY